MIKFLNILFKKVFFIEKQLKTITQTKFYAAFLSYYGAALTQAKK